MAGRTGSAASSNVIAYVGLGVLGMGMVLGLWQLRQAGEPPGQGRSIGCMTRLSCAGPTPPPTMRPAVRDPGGGWSGIGRPSETGLSLPLPLIAGGGAAFALFWWDVPRRLWNRYGPGRKTAAERRRDAEARAAALAAAAEQAEADTRVTVAAIDPGIAGKGLRVRVRACEITLRPGAAGTVELHKTLAGTSDREFTQAGRLARRSLRDPEFVSRLIEDTGHAVAYLDGNPQLPGADARRAELRSLKRALEELGRGPSG